MSDPADDNDVEIPEALLVEPVYSRLELVLFVVIGGSVAAFAGLVWLLTKANVLGESKKDVAGHELVESPSSPASPVRRSRSPSARSSPAPKRRSHDLARRASNKHRRSQEASALLLIAMPFFAITVLLALEG